MITDIEDYFVRGCGRCDRFATPGCSVRRWDAGLSSLRRICLEAGLAETVKWGHPCYMHAGRNVAIIGAFRNDLRLSFFQAALMTDLEKRLEKKGPNTRHADMIRFTENGQVAELEPVLRSYLIEAMGYAQQGIRHVAEDVQTDMPAELSEALRTDHELGKAFQRLTPGRKKSYLLNIGSAKAAETRIARIARFRSHILAGKGATER